MAWPQDALSHDEEIITSFRPHWKLLFIPVLWALGLLIAFIIIISLAGWSATVVLWATVVVVGGLLVFFVVRPLVAWWTTMYVLTTERLITRTGLIAKSGVEIPLERITNVNFSQSAIERVLKAGDLLIESAGSTGQSKFSNIPNPDEFQALLYKVREQRSIELSGARSAPAAAAPPVDRASTIRDLAKLRDDGLISEAEYEEKRRKLLEEM